MKEPVKVKLDQEQVVQIEKRLQQLYDEFINENDERAFFIGLKRYLKHTEQVPVLLSIIEVDIKALEQGDTAKIRDLAQKVISELNQGAEKIFKLIDKYVQSNAFDIRVHIAVVQNKMKDGSPIANKADELYHALDRLLNTGRMIAPAKIPQFELARSYPAFVAELKQVKNKWEPTNVWFVWQELLKVYPIQERIEVEIGKAVAKKDYLLYVALASQANEWRDIMAGKQLRRHYLDKNKFHEYAKTVHHYLLSKLDALRENQKQRQASPEDLGKYFWFDDMTFKIKRVDRADGAINFYPKKGQGTNTYCLFRILVDRLRGDFESEGHWIKATIKRSIIISGAQKLCHGAGASIDQTWVKNTIGNVKQKIPDDLQGIIKIGTFDRKSDGYPIALKLPT